MSTVAILGAGLMGAAMASRLAEEGHDVRVWDRTGARATALEGKNITPCPDPAAAVGGADLALTMVTDAAAVRAVAAQMLAALGPHGLWLQTSTVGAAAADEFAALATSHGVTMIDAPVSGSTGPARAGALTWLISGPPAAIARARPVLDSLGSRCIVAGEGQQASRLKLVVNGWMCAATTAMADALEQCDRLSFDPASFLAAIEDGPLSMPYASAKGELMRAERFAPGFPVHLALKDMRLLGEAVGDTGRTLHALVTERLARAEGAGHGDDDVAAVAAVPADPEA